MTKQKRYDIISKRGFDKSYVTVLVVIGDRVIDRYNFDTIKEAQEFIRIENE